MNKLKKHLLLTFYYFLSIVYRLKKSKIEKTICIGWAKIKYNYYIVCDFNSINVMLKSHKKGQHIINTPHYDFIVEYNLHGKRNSKYINYIREYFPHKNPRVEEEKFINLFHAIQNNNFDVYSVGRFYLSFQKKILIIDGVHRLAITYVLNRTPKVLLYHEIN